MLYRRFGNSDLKVSVVSLGTWAMGGTHWGKAKDRESIETIHKAVESGINLIDTAPVYGDGHSEKIVGKAIKGIREKVIVATKCGVHTRGDDFYFDLAPAEVGKEVETSLRRLDIEIIDLYQCHWPDKNTPIEDTMEEMLKLRAEGKIRHIGVSNFNVELLVRARKIAPVISLQPHYSLLEREIEKEALPYCRQHDIGIMAYGPLGSGILTGKYRERPTFSEKDARSFFYPFFKEPLWSKAQSLLSELRRIAELHGKPVAHVAINWVIQQPGITTAIVGARTPAQAETNAAAAEWLLSDDDLSSIDAAYKRIFT
jgi:aryl-alcohol dehydrogenase-like predicted oxidoreductase